MAKNVKLLLKANVDNLGIVGDVVNVKVGYARNYLLPRDLATVPSEDLIESLAAKRAEAEKELAARRTEREGVIGKLEGVAMTLTRACNDQGHLYGSVTQQDISGALTELGFPVAPREVRIAQTIKRVGQHEVLIKFDADLEATIALHVEADRELEDEREEMEFDNEGNLIEKRAAKPRVEEKAEEKAAVAEG